MTAVAHKVSPPRRVSEGEYLAIEASSDTRHELIGGTIHAMGGASLAHNRLAGSFFASLRRQLANGPCEVFMSDLRIRVDATGLFAYPDVLVLCGKPELWDDPLDTVTNPKVIIEVLSPTTEAFDRGDKFIHYRHIPSLSHYLMARQDRILVEHYRRQEDLWVLHTLDAPDALVRLNDIGCELALDEVYLGVIDR